MSPLTLLSMLLPMALQASTTSDGLLSPVIPMIDVCPPFNSSWHVMDYDEIDQCKTDDQCLDFQKCCCTPFDRQCVIPVQVKLGRCPPAEAVCSHMSSRSTCQSDEECPDSQRCCDICGKTCWNPEPDPDGLCPVPNIIPISLPCSSVQCASDSECTSDKKCCIKTEVQACIKLPSAMNTRDECPSVKYQNCLSPHDNKCESDSQCHKSQKCCCSNCGWKCVNPIKVKPGRCPARDPKCIGIGFAPVCQTDTDCFENEKCCDICGMTCSKPEPEPPGVCPVSEVLDVHHLHCSSVMCSSKEDCAPQRRCCLTEDSQKCLQPQPAVLNVCPPFNPGICTMPRHIINRCQNDSSCQSPLKCCCSNCGWQCVAPVQVKPGRCPPIKPKCTDTKPKPTCESDSDCSSNKKCCDICGKSCWTPDPEPFGSCPVVKDTMKPHCPTVQCSRDVDCAADEKCCLSEDSQKCVKPYPVLQTVCPRFKPGHCPVGRVENECNIDTQCSRLKKCCCTACGRKCVSPVHVKPGRCPNIPYMCAPFPPNPLCDTDTDCPGDNKCCNICGFACHAPVPEPMGVCPFSQVKDKMLDCPSILCTSDSDCSVREKCCSSTDEKKCMLPKEELSPSGMIRVCPLYSFTCLPHKSYLNECQGDSDCSSSQKCCCSGCSFRCMSPKEVKPGRCPKKVPNVNDVLKATKCLVDRNCPDDMKCCKSLGLRCWKPIMEPLGTCRELSGPRNASCSFVTCTRHDDCPLQEKCCPTATGQSCMFTD